MSLPALLPPSAAEAAEEAKRVTRWSIALSRCTAMRSWADLLSILMTTQGGCDPSVNPTHSDAADLRSSTAYAVAYA